MRVVLQEEAALSDVTPATVPGGIGGEPTPKDYDKLTPKIPRFVPRKPDRSCGRRSVILISKFMYFYTATGRLSERSSK